MTTYTLSRDMRGTLTAKTVILLDEKRRLWIETSKGYNGLRCAASVMNDEGGGALSHCFSFGGPTDDYRKTISTDRQARATEKAIRSMHEAALAGLDAIVTEAEAHYAAAPDTETSTSAPSS